MHISIEDYGLIGDCETAALVGRNGSIDWLCWPRFDSDACFAALLGTPENGCWSIAPADGGYTVSRNYRGDTLIIETRFKTAEGTVCLIDFMPLRDDISNVVRLIVGESGCVAMHMELVIRFGYGKDAPWVTRQNDGALRAVSGPDMLVLHTSAVLKGEGLKTISDFSVASGETISFVLSYTPSHQTPPAAINPHDALAATEAWWENWSRQSTFSGEWSEAVTRSLITLKALTYAPTGGIIAAPTTSLPEQLGGGRNWDYRFCWLRDATLTLLALMDAGYFNEAEAWRNWLLRAVAGSPQQMQIMYGIAGERRLDEWQADWLPGYGDSQPVRIGNAAAGQLQLDVYGELMDALYLARRGGLPGNKSVWALQIALIQHLETIWQLPDAGIWEVRGPQQHFTYSKVMAWVALDRAIQSIESFNLEGPVDRWRVLREHIHEDVCKHGIDPIRGCFVQAYGSTVLDASLLLLPQLGFLPVEDYRIQATIAAVEREFLHDGFVLRYDTTSTDDGLPSGEGAFLACSFWLIDAYELCGRHDEACTLFEKLLAIRNDLGLLAEQFDPRAGRQVGNFPQAFSHIALINTAHNLSRTSKPAMQRRSCGVVSK